MTSFDPEDGAAEETGSILYHGDAGDLPVETRRALAQLLVGPSVDGRRHPNLWSVLLRDEAAIRRNLSNIFLELILDRDQEIAFLRQADADELEVPLLLRKTKLTFIDSVLLLHLRHLLIQAEARGERAVVSPDEVHNHLQVYRKATSTDPAGFSKRIGASWDKVKKHSIVQKLNDGGERYEISPTLKLLLSAEQIQSLTRTYQLMAEGRQPAADEQPDDDAA